YVPASRVKVSVVLVASGLMLAVMTSARRLPLAIPSGVAASGLNGAGNKRSSRWSTWGRRRQGRRPSRRPGWRSAAVNHFFTDQEREVAMSATSPLRPPETPRAGEVLMFLNRSENVGGSDRCRRDTGPR